MAGVRGALTVAVMSGAVLFGAVACGGSSTVTAPTTAIDGGGEGASSGPTTPPATAPSSASGSASPAKNAKDTAFIAKLRAEGLVASDENIVGAAGMVCAALDQNPSKTYIEKTLPTYVKAMIGQSRVREGVSAADADKAATADATKLIAEARASYCKA